MDLNSIETLKALLAGGDPRFWAVLKSLTGAAQEFDELFLLSSLRKKANARPPAKPGTESEKVRLAMMGACSLHPLRELVEHFCQMEGVACEIWAGGFDNYTSEIMDEGGGLYAFAPQIVLLIPSGQRCRYSGSWADSRALQETEARNTVNSLLELVRKVHKQSHAEVLLANFILPPQHDPGTYRTRTLGSDWAFRKWVNLELGLNAPPHLHICDLEFLAYRHGGLQSHDDRAWFESRQPCSASLLVGFAREVARLILSLRRPPKKVLVMDLDNTLWGGVVAEDGLEGIELGDTSPRGEAFKAFQKYIASLKQRGVLLAVSSKNDASLATEVFEQHPEMVLQVDDIAAFKANWEPKPDNLRQIAAELNLGLDSFVFVDDNPAEIEIVRQFAPEVTTILLGTDAAGHVAQLQDCRLFEPQSLTIEDAGRSAQYRSEARRKAHESTATDMDSFLESLAMEAVFSEFSSTDVPRLAQLINKSNQFNLTTRRRTEAEIHALIGRPEALGFSVRLKDRFGDHGLISIVIAEPSDGALQIDTWLMSCRVLKRQVEEEVLNELVRLAASRGCARVQGVYLPTPKNEMVRDFYLRLGFTLVSENATRREFEMITETFRPIPTRIKIVRRAYEPG